jgi:hypothetical protein
VREELPERDGTLVAGREFGEVARHFVIEIQLALVHERHERGGGGDRLGERRGVEDRVEGHRFLGRQQGSETEGLAVDHTVGTTDGHHAAGELALRQRLGDQPVDFGGPGRRGRCGGAVRRRPRVDAVGGVRASGKEQGEHGRQGTQPGWGTKSHQAQPYHPPSSSHVSWCPSCHRPWPA